MLTIHTTVEEMMRSEKARFILQKYIPGIISHPAYEQIKHASLEELYVWFKEQAAKEKLQIILQELYKPLSESVPELLGRKSMDELDKESFKAGVKPFEAPTYKIELEKGKNCHPPGVPSILLDGEWQMAQEGDEIHRINDEWMDAIPAAVPGSVHAALVRAGRIPDPVFAKNQLIAREESFKTWWLCKRFRRPGGGDAWRLVFDGVCNRCDIWLNGNWLGSHEGMFGGPEYDIGDLIKDENRLVVRLSPIPYEYANEYYNVSWTKTVVFSNAYGWHYSSLPSLGIWRSVRLESQAEVSMPYPFITSVNAQEGRIKLSLELIGKTSVWSGKIQGSIQPENFEGDAWRFEKEIRSESKTKKEVLEFCIPKPKLWWPVDLGEQNLYRLILSFVPENGGICERKETVFGIRTIEMAPLPDGARENKYNWTFVINGEPHFMKGAGWCTLDPLMDFSKERYERFLSLAAAQHIQMLRCWGGGMPETEEFYSLCDHYGIGVFQEWPTAWDSDQTQPIEILEETVIRNTLRLRNHPSLFIWGGGNESKNPYGDAIQMMGRLAEELDGTRPFHRSEPFGGSQHNYACYWRRKHLDYCLSLTADFWGEFGIASLPLYESVQRYLPEDEKNLWPPKSDGAFAYHTPMFNTAEDLSRLRQYAGYFAPNNCGMKEFIAGSQLAQATGVRHMIERARVRWPWCTGALYYKLNDNYPGASWATVDWYGAPKLSYYIIQDSFEPFCAIILCDRLNFQGTPVAFPVFLLNDAQTMDRECCKIFIRAYNGELQRIKEEYFETAEVTSSPLYLGDFRLSAEETDSTPLFITAEVWKQCNLIHRTFYWFNYEARRGSLFSLPSTTLCCRFSSTQATITNLGKIPAVGVEVFRPEHSHTFTVSDNFFWLEPGENKCVHMSDCEGVKVKGWNVEI